MKQLFAIILLLCSNLTSSKELPLDKLLLQLKADDFPIREHAMAQLATWATANRNTALITLPGLLKQESDPESSIRIQTLLRNLYLSKQESYFGIQFALKPSHTYQNRDITGILIVSIQPDGPSSQAGLRRGDIILAINNIPFPPKTITSDVAKRMISLPPRKKVSINILREKKKLTINMKPGVRPRQPGDDRRKEEKFRQWLRKQLR